MIKKVNNVVKIFNKLIQYKVAPYFGEVLLDCKLIGRDYRFGDYRYDLLFIFENEYNNPRIQLESVFNTCDDLFNWVDLRELPNLSIVIMNKFGRNQHYSYFELMHEIINGYHTNIMYHHPMYKKYREWESNKLREKALEKKRHSYYQEQMKLLNFEERQPYREEKEKKKFLFW
jgi:hypothetical protein